MEIDFDHEKWEVKRRIKGSRKEDESIIDVVSWNGGTFILKVNVRPSWNIHWEHRVTQSLYDNLGGLLPVARKTQLVSLTMVVDKEERVVDYFRTNNTTPLWKTRKVTGMLIEFHEKADTTFSQMIRKHKNLKLLFSGLYQVLCSLLVAQTYLGFTHYDLHPTNIVVEPFENPNTVILFDFDQLPPMVVFSGGFLLRLIDYEYSHVEGICGQPFDAKLKLIPMKMNPTEFDSNQDILRFLISTCYFYHSLHHSSVANEIRKTLVHEFRSHVQREQIQKTTGLLENTSDPIYQKINSNLCYHQQITKERQLWFIEHYYQVISMLMHQSQFPLVQSIDQPNYDEIIRFLVLLLSMEEVPCSYLIMVVQWISQNSTLEEIEVLVKEQKRVTWSVRLSLWFASLKSSYVLLLPHLETLMSMFMNQIHQQNLERYQHSFFLPKHQILWLWSCFPQTPQYDCELGPTTSVLWLQQYKHRLVPSLSLVPPEVFRVFNDEPNLLERGRILLKAVNKIVL